MAIAIRRIRPERAIRHSIQLHRQPYSFSKPTVLPESPIKDYKSFGRAIENDYAQIREKYRTSQR